MSETENLKYTFCNAIRSMQRMQDWMASRNCSVCAEEEIDLLLDTFANTLDDLLIDENLGTRDLVPSFCWNADFGRDDERFIIVKGQPDKVIRTPEELFDLVLINKEEWELVS